MLPNIPLGTNCSQLRAIESQTIGARGNPHGCSFPSNRITPRLLIKEKVLDPSVNNVIPYTYTHQSGCKLYIKHLIALGWETHLVSSGTRPRQAMHIITPPISVRPPATQPTNRADPKVYLSRERMALNVVDSALQAPPTAPGHVHPLCPPFGFYIHPCQCPQNTHSFGSQATESGALENSTGTYTSHQNSRGFLGL